MIANVEEDRAEDTSVHMAFFTAKCEPIVHEPTVSNGNPRVAIYVLLNIFPAAIDQTLSRHPVVENAQHEPHCFTVQSTISQVVVRRTHEFSSASGHSTQMGR